MTYPTDDAGHPQVDFVWGNIPMQPDDERGMATLDPALDNHVIATTGYSNYPQFLPDYNGTSTVDEADPNALVGPDSVADAALEVLVPSALRLSRTAGHAAIEAVGLVASDSNVNYDITHVVSDGKTITVTTDGDNLLVSGDIVSVIYNNGDGFAGTWADVKLTNGGGSTIEFKLATAPSPALDFTSTGYVFNNSGIVLAQNPVAGTVANPGDTVTLTVLNGD